MEILILGHNGMLGNAVHLYLKRMGNFRNIEVIQDCRWDSDEYKNKIVQSSAEFIVNCAGAIPQKKYDSTYYDFLNVELPMFLEESGKKIIHASTDCEFSGELPYPQKYDKNAKKDAIDDYGKSKAKISEIIVNDFKNTKIIRTSIIGHEKIGKFSLLDWFLSNGDGV